MSVFSNFSRQSGWVGGGEGGGRAGGWDMSAVWSNAHAWNQLHILISILMEFILTLVYCTKILTQNDWTLQHIIFGFKRAVFHFHPSFDGFDFAFDPDLCSKCVDKKKRQLITRSISWYRGFPTRMIYLCSDIVLIYTILVGNPLYIPRSVCTSSKVYNLM